MSELLFSYGTLKKEEIQLKLFGRLLNGSADSLNGYHRIQIEMTDQDFIARGEQKIQFNLINTGKASDVIEGMVFEVTNEELLMADKYEPANYKRVNVILHSGKKAWIYMAPQYNYVTRLDIKFDHLEKIDIPQMVKDCTDKWFNQTLTKVNDSVVRIGIVEGEYHWHKHDNDDEFFCVLEGQFLIDYIDADGKEKTFELNPHQGVTITKGVMHRPRAPKKTVILMVETSQIVPTGD